MEKIIDKKIKKLNILFFSLLTISVIATLFVLYLKINLKYEDLVKAGSLALYLSPLTMIIVIILNSYLYKKAVEKAENLTDKIEKLQIFFQAKVVQYSLYSLAGIIAAIGLLLEYRAPNIFISVIILSFLVFNIPTKKKFDKDFNTEQQVEEE